ncbi:hypothetical protein OKA06_08210 [Novosphingobium sp. MW5]|nr:hypothetical protein [Novosphingobium sp. MW5]
MTTKMIGPHTWRPTAVTEGQIIIAILIAAYLNASWIIFGQLG